MGFNNIFCGTSGSTGLTTAQIAILDQVANYPPIEVAVASDSVISIAGSAASPIYLNGFYKIGSHNNGIKIVDTDGSDEGALLNDTGRDFCMCGEFSYTSSYTSFQGEIAVWSERSTDGINWTPNTKSFRRWDVSIVSEGSNSQPSYVETWKDGEYIRFCLFLDGSGTLTFGPTSEVVNGSFTVESFGCMWRLSEVPVDVNVHVIYEYSFDAIDDYATFGTTVNIYDGDTVTIRATVENSSYYRYIVSGVSGGLWSSATEAIGLSEDWGSLVDLYINGTQYASGVYQATVGEEIEITLVFTGETTMSHVGVSALSPSELWNGKISDIVLTRENPSGTNPDLSWPINEGSGTTVGIEANGNSEYNLTYNNFDDENWSEI